jgi:hypothetical protein
MNLGVWYGVCLHPMRATSRLGFPGDGRGSPGSVAAQGDSLRAEGRPDRVAVFACAPPGTHRRAPEEVKA